MLRHRRQACQAQRDENEPAFLRAVETLFRDRPEAMIKSDQKHNEEARQNAPPGCVLARHSISVRNRLTGWAAL
jgi:hypothetical protein